ISPSVRARVAVEEASTLGWDRYVGDGGAVIGMHTFGASAPLKHLLSRFGFTPERVAELARDRLAAAGREGRHGRAQTGPCPGPRPGCYFGVPRSRYDPAGDGDG